MSREVLAWHFSNGRLGYDPYDKIEPGYIYEARGKLALCSWGLHGSVDPLDALVYAKGNIVSRTRHTGEILRGRDKICSAEREHLWVKDVSIELRLFACWCVRNTPLHDGRKVWDLLADERSRNAVVVAERFAVGEANTRELLAAKDEAWGAAEAAAVDAAWAAAWAAASSSAAHVARASASAAAWDVAAIRARVAAWDAARGAQRKQFKKVLCAAKNREESK